MATVQRMGVMGYTGILYKEESFAARASGEVQTLILSSVLLEQMFGASLQETLIRSRILASIRQLEELQHLRMDQLDGLASLYELVTVAPNETLERPAFRLGFNLRGQAQATLLNKEGKELREPMLLKDPGKVLISEDADMEADSKRGPSRSHLCLISWLLCHVLSHDLLIYALFYIMSYYVLKEM